MWVIHGSLDWFWEMPALSGPALGFLGIAVALGREPERESRAERRSALAPVRLRTAAALRRGDRVCCAVSCSAFRTCRFGRHQVADNIAATNPDIALSNLSTAADLDPLSAIPGRAAGTVALHFHHYATAAGVICAGRRPAIPAAGSDGSGRASRLRPWATGPGRP